MLILVAVTVNVAMDGGLFEKSQDAKAKTDKNSEKEQLISAAVGALEEGANFNIQDMTLPEGATWITEKGGDPIEHQNQPYMNGNWVKTSKGNQFYIDNKGNVLDEEPSTEDPVTNIEDTIVGTYYLGGYDQNTSVVFRDNGTCILSAYPDDSEPYTIGSTYGTLGESNFQYDYHKVLDDNNNIINKVMFFNLGILTSNGTLGLQSISGTYVNGTDTIIFNNDGSVTGIIEYDHYAYFEDNHNLQYAEGIPNDSNLYFNGQINSQYYYSKNDDKIIDRNNSKEFIKQ